MNDAIEVNGRESDRSEKTPATIGTGVQCDPVPESLLAVMQRNEAALVELTSTARG
jgi:hypothetical protein